MNVIDVLIDNEGSMTFTQLFRKFRADYNSKDFGVLIDTMISAGTIALVPDGKGKVKRVNYIGGSDD